MSEGSSKLAVQDVEPLNAGSQTPLKGRLTLVIVSARHLAIHRAIGIADPYVEVRLGDEKYRSRVAKDGGINPNWDQAFTFNPKGDSQSNHLRVKVYDEGTLSDSCIGRCDVNIYETLSKGYKIPKEFQLAAEHDFSKINGFITMSVDFQGEGAPADPVKAEEEKKAAIARQAEAERQAMANEKAKLEQERKRLEQLTLDAKKAEAAAVAAKQQAEAAASTAASTSIASAPEQALNSAGATVLFNNTHPHAVTLIRDRYGVGKGYTCDVCRQQGTGLSWHCSVCGFDSHPQCIEKSTEYIKTHMDSKHPHILTLELCPYNNSQYICKKCSKTNKGEAWRCEPCKYDVCIKCK